MGTSTSTTTIIVGAGSGGAVIAARLTEDPEHEVILIEAGPDYPEEVPADLLDASQMSVAKHDWHLKAFFVEPPVSRPAEDYPRGRVVGGCSSVNAAAAQRASVEDFDSWVAEGNPEWSYDAVLPYYAKLERDLDVGETTGHGTDGPVTIKRFARETWSSGAQAFEEACIARGFPVDVDANARAATGIGAMPRNLDGEDRGSALLTYIAGSRNRPNLTIVSETVCRRVLFKGTRAVGVEIERGGEVSTVEADRVVMASGAIHTPQLLTLSGVGPAAVLEKLGVAPVVVSEGVGQNLCDHATIPIMSLLKEPTKGIGLRAQLKFSSSEGELINDLMIFPTVLDPATLNAPGLDTKGLDPMPLVPLLAKPKSKGWLEVVSPDVHVQPEIHLNFLGERSDMDRLKEAVRLAWEIITSPPMSDTIDSIIVPDAATVGDDEKLEAYMRQTVWTSYHPVGTCRIGPDDDELAVVDQRLRVRGAEGLYVGDASIMHNVPTGLTNLTVFMIGERLSDWIKEDVAGQVPEPAAAAGS
jgi:choline dehydrogenase